MAETENSARARSVEPIMEEDDDLEDTTEPMRPRTVEMRQDRRQHYRIQSGRRQSPNTRRSLERGLSQNESPLYTASPQLLPKKVYYEHLEDIKSHMNVVGGENVVLKTKIAALIESRQKFEDCITTYRQTLLQGGGQISQAMLEAPLILCLKARIKKLGLQYEYLERKVDKVKYASEHAWETTRRRLEKQHVKGMNLMLNLDYWRVVLQANGKKRFIPRSIGRNRYYSEGILSQFGSIKT